MLQHGFLESPSRNEVGNIQIIKSFVSLSAQSSHLCGSILFPVILMKLMPICYERVCQIEDIELVYIETVSMKHLLHSSVGQSLPHPFYAMNKSCFLCNLEQISVSLSSFSALT